VQTSAPPTALPVEAQSPPLEPEQIAKPEPLFEEPIIPDFKAEPRTRKSKPRKRGKTLVTGLAFMCLLAGAGGLAALQYHQSQPLVPPSVQTAATIPLLYPDKLPAGYQVVKSSFNISAGGIIAYYAQNQTGNKLNFTIQGRPANFDFEKFYSQIMLNSTRFNTPLGEAAVGTANGHLLGSLATPKSWVLVSGNTDKVSAESIQTALSNLEVIEATN